MKPRTYLIFDFDGTLVDSFQKLLEKFNLFADLYHYRKIDTSDLGFLRNLTSKEFIQYLGVPLHKIPEVILQIRVNLHSEIPTLAYFPKVPETLESLRKLNIGLGILTSNSTENVVEWLKHNNLSHLFDFIRIESSYLDKGIVLKELLEGYNIDKSTAYYVGDETRDIDAAKGCGISAIGVTWGFNSAQILAQQNPDFLINSPVDLLEIFSPLAIPSLQNTVLN